MRVPIPNFIWKTIGRLTSKALATLEPTTQTRVDRGVLSIGDHTYGCPKILRYEGDRNKVIIGKFCAISHDVKIFIGGGHPLQWVSNFPFRARFDLPGKYNDGHPCSRGDVVIGNDIWIGMGATILSGVKVGHGAVISAQSFVVRNVPPYAVVAGNPAEVLFYRFREKQIKTLLQLRWWDWPLERILRSIHLLNGASIEDFILDAQTME